MYTKEIINDGSKLDILKRVKTVTLSTANDIQIYPNWTHKNTIIKLLEFWLICPSLRINFLKCIQIYLRLQLVHSGQRKTSYTASPQSSSFWLSSLTSFIMSSIRRIVIAASVANCPKRETNTTFVSNCVAKKNKYI